MKRNPLITLILGLAAQSIPVPNRATPSRSKGTRNKEGLPAGYPGAKLARKAARGFLTLRHT